MKSNKQVKAMLDDKFGVIYGISIGHRRLGMNVYKHFYRNSSPWKCKINKVASIKANETK